MFNIWFNGLGGTCDTYLEVFHTGFWWRNRKKRTRRKRRREYNTKKDFQER